MGSNVGKAHVDLSLIFLDEKFACARMFFEPREFSEVVDVFTARYGKPSINTLSTVAWVIAGTTVTASSNGAATVASREYAVYLDERRREHLKDAAKGL